MNLAQSGLLAIVVVLVVWSPQWSASDDPNSIYADALGARVEGSLLGGAPFRLQHGPVEDLDPQRDALLVVAPRLPYTENEAEAFRAFIDAGGRALVADSTGSARSLLARVPVDIEAASIYSTSFARNPTWPILERPGGGSVVLSAPHTVNGTGEVLLRAHPFSWKDLDNDLAPDLNEPNGPWPVALRADVGAGNLTVIGDDDLFLQTVSAAFADEQLAWLAAGRTIVVDEGHRASADPIQVTPLLSGAAPIRATLLGLAVVAFAIWRALDVRLRRAAPIKDRRPLPNSEVLGELPDPS